MAIFSILPPDLERSQKFPALARGGEICVIIICTAPLPPPDNAAATAGRGREFLSAGLKPRRAAGAVPYKAKTAHGRDVTMRRLSPPASVLVGRESKLAASPSVPPLGRGTKPPGGLRAQSVVPAIHLPPTLLRTHFHAPPAADSATRQLSSRGHARDKKAFPPW